MSLCQDRQIKGFLLFLTLFALLFVGTATVLTIYQVNDAEVLWLKHDEAVSSSLLEQGVPKEVIAVAFTNTDISEDGRSLLAAAGLGKQSESSMRPYFNQFQRSAFCTMLCTVLFFLFVLAVGIFVFFWKRKRLYQQADKILLNYINGDYSCHLPQNYEGAIYQVFSSVEQLATMLQSKNETERKAKEFLKDTISDISHQLKTPLAALTMYQEIIESEPENAETVKQFAAKMGFRGSKKNTPYAAQMAAQDCAKVAFDLGLRKVKAYVKGPGNGRESAIRTVHGAGIEVTEIIDVTPLPHNGCRPPKRRRV